jgi:uncharacterized protein YcfJ
MVLGAASVAAAPALVVYPAQGQSQKRQDRDRYECNQWAVEQTGFDPALAEPPPKKKGGILKGALGGAAVGGIIGSLSGDAGKGAAIGGLAGGTVGGVSQGSKNARAEAYQEQNLEGYNRALGACLNGRGYTVR